MGVDYGEAFMEGGRASLSICFLQWVKALIRFWHDRWIGDNTLKDLYPELYVCSAVKNACIFEVLWIPEGVLLECGI